MRQREYDKMEGEREEGKEVIGKTKTRKTVGDVPLSGEGKRTR